MNSTGETSWHTGTTIVTIVSLSFFGVTYPKDIHTVLLWSNNQKVNMYGKMQKWQLSQTIIYSSK
ncbi:conserved hypothetical protein [Trichinella spiralis]|uniref:hypothetical protein n=1 Tax=Trichinella spiralis TaxID=6334 RepID=UPI0001EFB200|nr:conserved hypothetical protein [Trichinella spiralis]